MFFLTLVLFVCLTNAYLGAARTLTRTLNRRTRQVDVTLTDEPNFEKEIFYQQKQNTIDPLWMSSAHVSDQNEFNSNDDIYCEKIQQQVNSLAKKSPFTFYVNHTVIKQKPKLE
jgi:hypothetical protein